MYTRQQLLSLRDYHRLDSSDSYLGLKMQTHQDLSRVHDQSVLQHAPERQLTKWLNDSRNVESLLEIAQTHLKYFNKYHFSAFWTRLKKLVPSDFTGPVKIREILLRTVGEISFFDSRALSNVIHAMGVLCNLDVQIVQSDSSEFNIGFRDAIETLAEELMKRDLQTFNSQNISNCLWALAKSGIEEKSAIEKLEEELMKRDLQTFNYQEISNCLWALAKSGIEEKIAIEKLAEELMKRDLQTFNTQDISNCLWALAKSGIEAKGTIEKLAKMNSSRSKVGYQNSTQSSQKF